MRHLTKEDVLKLVEDWRTERDPVAEGWVYANLLTVIVEQWAPSVPDTVIVRDAG